MIFALLYVPYVALGFAGFVFWWTTEYDLGPAEAIMGLFVGALVGPLAWIMGYFIHSDDRQSRVLIRKRDR